MKLKRIAATILTMMMAGSVVGCGGNTQSTSTTETSIESAQSAEQSKDATQSVETSTGDSVKIGLIAPTTGSVAQYGTAVDQGVKLAVEEINAAGGINGKQIELVSYDNKGDSTESINLFKRLVSNDKVVALIGPVVSGTSLAVAPLADEQGIPMITPTGTSLDITTDYDYVFRACFTDPYQGDVMAKFASENLGAKTAAILYNTGDDYSVGLAEAFEETFTAAGGTITTEEGYAPDTKDFKAVLSGIKEDAPDVLFCPDYYNNVGLIAEQVKEVGLTTTMVGGDGWDGVEQNYANVIEGSYFGTHYAVNDETEIVKNFVNSYKEKYNVERPTAFAALGYDATKILADAIGRAADTSGEAIKEALKATDMECVTGNVTFDAEGNPQKAIAVLKVVDGVSQLEAKVTQ